MSLLRDGTKTFRGGMNDSASSADDYAADQCELIINGRVDRDGSIAALGGSRLLCASPAAATDYGRGLVEFRPTSGPRELVKFTQTGADTTVQRSTDSGATWGAVATLAGIGGDWSLVTMVKGGTNYLLGAVGATNCYKYSGGGAGGWAAFTTSPVSGAKYLAVHNERLWASKGDSTVYGSKIADFETWASPDGLSLPVQTHDGENITGIAQAGGVLLVFKRHSVSYIDGFGYSDIIVAAGTRGISAGVGLIAIRTFQSVGSDWIWLSERGLEFWGGSGAPQPVAAGALSYIATIARNRITEATGTGSTPTLPCSVFWPERKEYWIAWPSGALEGTGNTALNDGGLILNVETGAVARRIWNPPGNEGAFRLHPGAMCLAEVTIADRSVVRPVILTKYGDVIAMDLGSTEQGGPALSAAPIITLTGALVVLDAEREAWRRALDPGESLNLNGRTLTDESGAGNHCTVAGDVLLLFNGSNWVFRFSSELGSTDAPRHIVTPALDLTAVTAVTAGFYWAPHINGNAGVICGSPADTTEPFLYLLAPPVLYPQAGAIFWESGLAYETASGAAPSRASSLIGVFDAGQPAGSQIAIYQDGSPVALTTVVPGNLTAFLGTRTFYFGRGGGQSFGGDIARITLQAAVPDSAERAVLHDFLTDGVENTAEGFSLDFRVRTRLYDFGQRGTWMREIDLLGSAAVGQYIGVYAVTDGLVQPFNMPILWEPAAANASDRPRRKVARCSRRGVNHGVEVHASSGFRLSSAGVFAHPLNGSY